MDGRHRPVSLWECQGADIPETYSATSAIHTSKVTGYSHGSFIHFPLKKSQVDRFTCMERLFSKLMLLTGTHVNGTSHSPPQRVVHRAVDFSTGTTCGCKHLSCLAAAAYPRHLLRHPDETTGTRTTQARHASFQGGATVHRSAWLWMHVTFNLFREVALPPLKGSCTFCCCRDCAVEDGCRMHSP